MYGPSHAPRSGLPLLWSRASKVRTFHDLGLYGCLLHNRLPVVLLGIFFGFQFDGYEWIHWELEAFRIDEYIGYAKSGKPFDSGIAVQFLSGMSLFCSEVRRRDWDGQMANNWQLVTILCNNRRNCRRSRCRARSFGSYDGIHLLLGYYCLLSHRLLGMERQWLGIQLRSSRLRRWWSGRNRFGYVCARVFNDLGQETGKNDVEFQTP